MTLCMVIIVVVRYEGGFPVDAEVDFPIIVYYNILSSKKRRLWSVSISIVKIVFLVEIIKNCQIGACVLLTIIRTSSTYLTQGKGLHSPFLSCLAFCLLMIF